MTTEQTVKTVWRREWCRALYGEPPTKESVLSLATCGTVGHTVLGMLVHEAAHARTQEAIMRHLRGNH